MVDALTTIRDWLTPDGLLIDIHPTAEPPPIVVRIGRTEYPAGWLYEARDDEKYEQASAALAEAVRQGTFAWVTRTTFTFTYEADTLAELQTFLADNWHGAALGDVVSGEIAGLMGVVSAENAPKTILLREAIYSASLRPLSTRLKSRLVLRR